MPALSFSELGVANSTRSRLGVELALSSSWLVSVGLAGAVGVPVVR